jgi:hypothetical protein
MKATSPAAELDGFIARFSPEIAAQARAVLKTVRARLPGAVEMVYDNYYALVVGFSPVEKASQAILSVAVYPRWINLNFFAGDWLPDSRQLLRGSGKINRHLRLDGPEMLNQPAVKALIKAAVENAARPLDRKQPGRIVIVSVSPNPRPRRVGAST